jgi:hypothetical protein
MTSATMEDFHRIIGFEQTQTNAANHLDLVLGAVMDDYNWTKGAMTWRE